MAPGSAFDDAWVALSKAMWQFQRDLQNCLPFIHLQRTWAATWIRQQLRDGMPTGSIAHTCEASRAATIAALRDRQVSFTMLGVTGTGPTIDAALRHWCEIVEARP